MLSKKWLRALGLAIGFGLTANLSVQAAPADPVAFPNSIAPLTERVRVLEAADPGAYIGFDVALKLRNYGELRSRLARRETLSTATFEERHFPLKADYAAVRSWLELYGLSVERTYSNRLSIRARGTVSQVQAALGSEFSKVRVDGQEYIGATTAPSLPTSLARFAVGVNGLQPWQQARPLNSGIQPLSPTSAYAIPYSVKDIKTAYNATGVTTTGSGQRIAVLIDTFPLDSDLTTFWSNNGIAQSLGNIEKVQAVSGTLPATSGEETLDAEWTSGIASAAKVRIYASQSLSFVNLDKAFQRIISDLGGGTAINALSISLGACEADLSTSQLTTDDQYLATIAGYGVTTFVSSGDSGSNGGCTSGTGVDFYASSPNATAVGGTNLKLTTSGTLSSETGWSGSGGGNSSYFARPSWQVGNGVPSGSTRVVPDVALDADPNTGFYLIYKGGVVQIGGTSASAPVWAGFTALINQGRLAAGKSNLGFLNPTVYPLLGSANFRDITSGSNGSYSAASGYDRVTGIGVPLIGTLYNTLVGTSNPPPPTQLLGNPGFENGSSSPSPWVVTAGVIDSASSPPAHSGTWKAWLDGYGTTHTDTLYQQVAIASGVSSARLSFYLYITTAERTTTTAYDTLKVQVRNSAGTVLATLATYSNLNKSTGYIQKSFDLSAYKGQTVQIYLVGSEDSSLQTSFVVDDFALDAQ